MTQLGADKKKSEFEESLARKGADFSATILTRRT